MRSWLTTGFACCLVASGPSSSLPAAPPVAKTVASATADELARAGHDAYRAGDWAKADSAFHQFLAEYGANPQAASAAASIRPQLAMCRIRLGRLAEALPLLESVLQRNDLAPAIREELLFWFGICQMQAGKNDEARVIFEKFAAQYPASMRKPEAQLLSGSILVAQAKYSQAADHFAGLLKTLRGFDRGRAVCLLLHCLNQTSRFEDALALVAAESSGKDILQLAGFQLLALDLGSRLLEKGEHRKAIAALQRVWNQDRVLKHQEERLEFLKNRLAAFEAQKADPQWTFSLSQSITKIERELKTFREMENYDSAVQLRLASAFLEMKRYREAALLLDAMLKTMPPDNLVEKASINLMQCWLTVGRWPKVAESFAEFETKFPNSGQLPLALFLKGEAEQRAGQYARSIETFDALRNRFPNSELRSRAGFMAAYGELMHENFPAALERLGELLSEKEPIAETALYWRGVALSMDRQYANAREALDEYLESYKGGQFVSEALFRKAYCAQAEKKFETAVAELKTFLRKYPNSPHAAEALLLLGDAYLAEGEMERGLETYKRIPPTESRYFEEGWFKIGKALRLQENYSALRAHMLQFRSDHPQSARLAEALYWLGWAYRNEDQLEEARNVYWKALAELGDNPAAASVEDLFSGLAKLYSSDELSLLLTKLETLIAEAKSSGRKTLATRALWALAHLEKKRDPVRAQSLLLEAASGADLPNTNARLLADFAQAAFDLRKVEQAEKLYRELLKWNPRSSYKDRALAGLGIIALQKNDQSAALHNFERFDREIEGSRLAGEVQLNRARIFRAQSAPSQAKQALEKLLGNKETAGRQKAEALILMGELLIEEREFDQAIAHLQRVYVMYNRWPDMVAKAYLASAQSFEKISDRDSAVQTYREMISREELASFAETIQAKERLAALEKEPSL